MMEGGLVRPSEAFKTRSSRSSNLASVRRDGTSISIGRFCSNAHFKLATLSGVDFTSMVESETGTVVAERYEGGDVGTGSTRLNGTTTDTIGVLLVDCNLRNPITLSTILDDRLEIFRHTERSPSRQQFSRAERRLRHRYVRLEAGLLLWPTG